MQWLLLARADEWNEQSAECPLLAQSGHERLGIGAVQLIPELPPAETLAQAGAIPNFVKAPLWRQKQKAPAEAGASLV